MPNTISIGKYWVHLQIFFLPHHSHESTPHGGPVVGVVWMYQDKIWIMGVQNLP